MENMREQNLSKLNLVEEVGTIDEKDAKLNKYACGSAILASVISVIFGYDTGVMSGAMIFIKEDLKINDKQVEILAGILNLCALIGSILAGRTSDHIGRRYTIVLASILFLLGSILMGYGINYAILMIGRCIAGVGVGFALMIAPIYTAEISSATHRGKLSSLPELCISIGILLGYISNYLFGKLTLTLGWRLMLGVAAIPSLALAFAVLKMPESPRWLIMKGRIHEAKNVLFLVSNSKMEAQIRLEDIMSTIGISLNEVSHLEDNIVIIPPKQQSEASLWKDLVIRPSKSLQSILLAALGIHFFEHACGIEAVILYSPRIFKAAGITSKSNLLLATVGVGLTKTIFILFATFLLDKIGRRPMLLTSTAGVLVALVTMGLGLTIAQCATERASWALALSIVGTYVYIAFFSIGLSPITWVYTSEIFPLKFRALGAGLGVAVNRSMNAVVSMSFISIYKEITIGGTFFMFAGLAGVAWIFFYCFVPETKGKTLEEIEFMFSMRAQARHRDTNSGISSGRTRS